MDNVADDRVSILCEAKYYLVKPRVVAVFSVQVHISASVQVKR